MAETPFDVNPFEESNPWDQPSHSPSGTSRQEAPVRSDTEAFVATLKYGSGYDAPWLVVRGASAGELDSRIKEAMTSGLMTTVGKAAAHVVKMAPGAGSPKTFQGGQVVNANTGQPVAQQAPSAPAGGAAPTCQHGPRTFREGAGKNGPWAAYFCPTPQGTPDQCKALWRQKDGSFK